MAKLKNSILPREQKDAFYVYRAQEFYVVTKTLQQTYSWVNRQSEHLTFSVILNVKVNLMEWTLCKMQYIGKGEAAFNNHRKDTKKPNSILPF